MGSIAEQFLRLRLEDGQHRPRERYHKREREILDIRNDARTVVTKLIAQLEATRPWNDSRSPTRQATSPGESG